jgi:hypothetical protein
MNQPGRAAEVPDDGESLGTADVVTWLVWLLPRVGLVGVGIYVLGRIFGMDPRVVAGVAAEGRWIELVGSLIALTGWAAGLLGAAVLQNWPVALVLATLAALVWAIRYL